METQVELPDSESPRLCLRHPSDDECIQIWTNTSASWKDSLSLPQYLAESQYLTSIPLAKDGGMTIWVLVDSEPPADQRWILASCETFRKRSLMSDSAGNVEEVAIHGIASVFCAPEYRGRGYAGRLMRELAGVLRKWQSQHGRIIGSVLYSDIGKKYYSGLGWLPNTRNTHLEFESVQQGWPSSAKPILEEDLEKLCRKDESIIRTAMKTPTPGTRKRVTILPGLDHMLWHIRKEDFASQHIFDKIPTAKGAIAGEPGKQVWAIWTHRYYEHPDQPDPDSVLYILRLVVEGDPAANGAENNTEGAEMDVFDEIQRPSLEAVIQAAISEAAEWRLNRVELWEPSPLVRKSLREINYREIERQEVSIASGMWYAGELGAAEPPVWINNEHYAWC